MDESDRAKRNHLQSELRAVESALTHYRSVLEAEERIVKDLRSDIGGTIIRLACPRQLAKNRHTPGSDDQLWLREYVHLGDLARGPYLHIADRSILQALRSDCCQRVELPTIPSGCLN